MNFFHATLLARGFLQVRPGFYTRPTRPEVGGTLFCLTNQDDRPRQLLLWQAQRVLLLADVVTLDALQQVLDRVLAREARLPPARRRA